MTTELLSKINKISTEIKLIQGDEYGEQYYNVAFNLINNHPENINQLYNDKSDIDTSNCRTNQCRSCNKNLTSNDPASQYQKQKIIQNTVRVPSSLYTMNLAALNVYQKPKSVYSLVDIAGSNYVVSPGVNWNQMSDRREPHH